MSKREELLNWFVRHLVVKPFELNGKVQIDAHGDKKLSLMFVVAEPPTQFGPDTPIAYYLNIAGNSYDEACLNELGGKLAEAKELLSIPEPEELGDSFVLVPR